MESREMIKEIIAELVSEETIDDAIREIVSNRLNYNFDRIVEETARSIVNDKAESYIKERVDEVLDKPVKTDDGWGHTEYYDSFEHFVKSIIREKISSNYKFSQEIDRRVKERLDKVIKKVSKEMSEKAVDEALAEMAKQEA